MSGEALIRELRSIRALVLHPSGPECDELVRHLKRIGCKAKSEWPPVSSIADDVDVVFCLIEERGQYEVPWLRQDPPVPVVAIITYESPTVVRTVLESGASAVISKPIRTFGILSTLVVARAIHRYEKNQAAKIDKLMETLRSRHIVEHAVRVLVRARGISEQEAYVLIRRQSMAKRLPMAVVAQSVVRAEDIIATVFDRDP